MASYHMNICGLPRDLTLCPISDKVDIAAFIMWNDVELTVKAAQALLERAPDFDLLLTAEAKGIPLCYEMARQCGKPYLVARKGKKLYMKNPVQVDVRSISTDRMQTLLLDEKEARLMEGKRVLLVDDVISTGESIQALERLCAHAKAQVAGRACVLAEGDAIERKDIIYLEPLPLFFK